MTAPVTELTDRARDVFRIVVESYIDSGAPVGKACSTCCASRLSGNHGLFGNNCLLSNDGLFDDARHFDHRRRGL